MLEDLNAATSPVLRHFVPGGDRYEQVSALEPVERQQRMPFRRVDRVDFANAQPIGSRLDTRENLPDVRYLGGRCHSSASSGGGSGSSRSTRDRSTVT